MKTLSKNKDLIIQKSDKVNSIILINKSDYLDKMYSILSNSKKNVKSSIVDDKHLNIIIGIEKKLTDLLKKLKASEAISEIDYKKLKPRGSSFGVLYGLCKTHKKVLDKWPPFRPILSAIKSPSYNLAKFLVLTLSPFSPIYHWRKLLKSVVTHFIRIKNCNINKNQFEKILRAALSNNYFLFDSII